MISEQIQQIELNIKQARKLVDMGDALERLKANRDFKKVITEGYFEAEAIRLVHLKSDPNFDSADMQQSIINQMNAIGSLSQYFHTLFHKASIARKAIAADEETKEELLSEEMNDE